MSNAFRGMRFCGCPVDRAAALKTRKNPKLVRELQEGPNARFLAVQGKKILASTDNSGRTHLIMYERNEILSIEPRSDNLPVYLGPVPSTSGYHQEVFVAEFSPDVAVKPGSVWLTGRELLMSDAADSDVATAGLALAITDWHQTALYDGRSGKGTTPIEGGFKRQVEGGGSKVYPRTDPVAIGLIISPDGKKCLLGRSHKYTRGMYTCLSGFVEQCESVEEAFKREVREEVGIHLSSVHLVASQPWPIGRAGSCELMIACRAIATSEQLDLNKDEIEDARWFNKDEVQQMLARSVLQPYRGEELFVPPPYAIAHHLIQGFAAHPTPHESKLSSTVFASSGLSTLLVALAGAIAGVALARSRFTIFGRLRITP